MVHVCYKCGESRLEEFSKCSRSKSGLQSKCRECDKKAKRERTELRQKLNPKKVRVKECKKCGELDLTKFNKRDDCYLGLMPYCKTCEKENADEYYEKNKEKRKKDASDYSKNNREKTNKRNRDRYRSDEAYRITIADANKRCESKDSSKLRRAESRKNWSNANRKRLNSQEATRRSIKFNAVPISITEEEMLQIDDLYKHSSSELHVDHIIPLQGELPNGDRIMGSHRLDNLQLLEPKDNYAKGNKINEDELIDKIEGFHYLRVPKGYFLDPSKYKKYYFE